MLNENTISLLNKNIISYGGLGGGQDNGIPVNNTLVIWKNSRSDIVQLEHTCNLSESKETTETCILNALKLRRVFVLCVMCIQG